MPLKNETSRGDDRRARLDPKFIRDLRGNRLSSSNEG
jgi:hypothetical protein